MEHEKIYQILDQYNLEEKKRCPFPTGIVKVYFDRLESNISQLSKFAENKKGKRVKFLLPIKANGYGSGMLPVAKVLEHKKLCDYFGVAHLQEAFNLRENGILTPILIMGQSSCDQEHLKYIIQNNIEQAISDSKLLRFLDKEAKKINKIAKIHLLVDTGMGRCGVLFKNISEILDQIYDCKNIELTGVMTHFSVADVQEKDEIKYTEEQINKFEQVKEKVIKKFPNKNIIFHTSNSGGVIENPSSIFDMIRPGIAVYGYPEHSMGLDLKPIMDMTSSLTLIKKYPKGHAIGYGRTYEAKENEHIAIVPIGYGDGLNRSLSNKLTILVNGKKVKSVGRISMDQFSILVGSNAKAGDEVVIIGEQNGIINNAYDISRQAGTITYEVICNLGNAKRIRHEYFYDKE